MRWKQPVKLQQRDNEVISCPVTPHSVRDQGFGDGLTDRVDLCEASKKEIKDILIQYGRTLQVADPRCCESEEFGGPGARARYQKSYR